MSHEPFLSRCWKTGKKDNTYEKITEDLKKFRGSLKQTLEEFKETNDKMMRIGNVVSQNVSEPEISRKINCLLDIICFILLVILDRSSSKSNADDASDALDGNVSELPLGNSLGIHDTDATAIRATLCTWCGIWISTGTHGFLGSGSSSRRK